MGMKKFLCKFMTFVMIVGMIQVPVFAEETQYFCGKEVHTHDQNCYLTCEKTLDTAEAASGDEVIYHEHEDGCYGEDLTCGKEEHTHAPECEKAPEDAEKEALLLQQMMRTAGMHQDHNTCGVADCSETESHSCEAITWTPVNTEAELSQAARNGVSVYLAADIDLTASVQISKDMNLCLNDHVLRQIGADTGLIFVSRNVAFSLCDCSGESGTTRYWDVDPAGLWTLKSSGNSEYTTVGGVITGGSSSAVYNMGTFTMYGGSISGNATDSDGGGVSNYNSASFTMNGGSISGNTAEGGGGGVGGSTFTMNGGSISGNTAGYGGGVYNGKTFIMTGGSISGNKTAYGGGDLTTVTFTMTGGTLGGADSSAPADICVGQGKVYLHEDAAFANNVLELTLKRKERVFLAPALLNNGLQINLQCDDNIADGAVLVQGWDGSQAVPLGDNLSKFSLNQTAADKAYGLVMTEAGAVALKKGYHVTVHTQLAGTLSDAMMENGYGLYLENSEGTFLPFAKVETGIYSVAVQSGTYTLYYGTKDAKIKLKTVDTGKGGVTETLTWYSVTYDAKGGTINGEPTYEECVLADNEAKVIATPPVREGYFFMGWSGRANTYQPGDPIAEHLSGNVALEAQWAAKTRADIVVKLDHKSLADAGFDQAETVSNVEVVLSAKKAGSNDAYEPVQSLQLQSDPVVTGISHTYTSTEEFKLTTYTGTAFTDLDPTKEYRIDLVKDDYVPAKDANKAVKDSQTGIWTLEETLQYNPNSFDMAVNVAASMEKGGSVPTAAKLKYLFFNEDVSRNQWEVITQHENVHTDVALTDGAGTAKYPVWQYIADTERPYGNRAVVTGIVVDGKELTFDVSNLQKDTFASTEHGYVVKVAVADSDKAWGSLDGVYYNGEKQAGTITATISDENAKTVTLVIGEGATLDGEAANKSVTLLQLKELENYVPVKDNGSVLEGWYTDEDCTNPVKNYTDLTGVDTIYPKWKEPKEIKATITVSGTYRDGEADIPINEFDRATTVVVNVEKAGLGGTWNPITGLKQTVQVDNWVDNKAVMQNIAIKVPNDNGTYRVVVEKTNYKMYEEDTFENEVSGGYVIPANDQIAAFIRFEPTVYDQEMVLDVSGIDAAFRPVSGVIRIEYKDAYGYTSIVQHNGTTKFGLEANIGADGTADAGSEPIWTHHADGELYQYGGALYSLTWADGTTEVYDPATAPFEVAATKDVTASTTAGGGYQQDKLIKVELKPKSYAITFNGVDGAANSADFVGQKHTWSYETNLADFGTPKKDGEVFVCWTEENQMVSIIPADMASEVTLNAVWHKLEGEAPTEQVGDKTFILVDKDADGKDFEMIEATPEAGNTGKYTDGEGNYYIPVDKDGDGEADIYVPVTPPSGDSDDIVIPDTEDEDVVYVPTGDADAPIYVPVTPGENGTYEPKEDTGEVYIPVDTDGDGKADIYVPVTPGENGTYVSKEGTGENGEVYIPVDTNGDGKADIYVPVTPSGDGSSTYEPKEETENVYIPVDTNDDGKVDVFIPVKPGSNGKYSDTNGTNYVPVYKDGKIEYYKKETTSGGGESSGGGGSSGGSGSSGGGGGGGAPAANVIVSKPENGKVTVGTTYAEKDTMVTITVTPDAGYEVGTVKVIDSDGNEVKVTDRGNGKYTFIKSDKKVTISVDFIKIEAEKSEEITLENVDRAKEIILTIDKKEAIVFGKTAMNDVAPIIRNERTMLPIRFVAEALGGKIAWNAAERKVTITKGEQLIEIVIDSSVAHVNGKVVLLDASAFIENDRTYLPLRFVAENLDATVLWDAKARQVIIVPKAETVAIVEEDKTAKI